MNSFRKKTIIIIIGSLSYRKITSYKPCLSMYICFC